MQQEVAYAYQLGPLEAEYAFDEKKVLAHFALMMVFAVLAQLVVSGRSSTTATIIFFMIASFLFFLIVGGGALLYFYFTYRQVRVALYANGLLYLNGNTSKVLYWQQMKRAYLIRGFLEISVYDGYGISIPFYISRFSEIQTRIKQAIAAHRIPG